jgi:Outer membrane protein beta-barrel domain
MKNNTLQLQSVSKKVVCWLFALVLLSNLFACGRSFFQGSFDVMKIAEKSKSPLTEKQERSLGLNLALMWIVGLDGGGSGASLQNAADGSTDQTQMPAANDSPWQLMYGMELIGKGGRFDDGFGTTTTRMTYLQAPVYGLYNYDLPNDKGRVFGGLGPYIGYGLFGKTTYKDSRISESYGAFDRTKFGYSRFDAGVNFTAGYQMPENFRFNLVYSLGLVNINPNDRSFRYYNRGWSLNVGYPLDKLVSKFKK